MARRPKKREVKETAMTASDRVAVAFAFVVGLFGFVILVGVLIQLLEGTSKHAVVTDVLLAILLGVIPLIGGVILYRRVRRTVARRQQEEREAAVLRVARDRQGVVTPVDVAADCGLSLEHAQEILDELHRRGFNEMDVSDTGVVVYRFRL
jgi:predicted transcriptional regulator